MESPSPASEVFPLLSDEQDPAIHASMPRTAGAGDSGDGVAKSGEPSALRMGQILLLCFARLVDPLSFFSIAPFFPEMIFKAGVRKADIGFYTGLIDSLFATSQMITMMGWGRLADRYGRKLVLAVSLLGISVTISFFGLCHAIWEIALLRCLTGAFSGDSATLQAMVRENSTKETQAKAFSLFAFFGNLAIFLGPLIGGLANPAEHFKSIFGHVHFFVDHPYILPTVVAGTVDLVAAVVCILSVKETLDKARKGSTRNNQSHHAMSVRELLKCPGTKMVLFLFTFGYILSTAFTDVAPTFFYTDVSLGGLGLESSQISVLISLIGVSQALWLLFAFPLLHQRVGTAGLLRICSMTWPLIFCLYPICNLCLRFEMTTPFWALLLLLATIGGAASMTFTTTQLALNQVAPSLAVLGTLNATALTLTSGVRAAAPALFSTIYATGVHHQIFWGYLGWLVMSIAGVCFTLASRWLPEESGGNGGDNADGLRP